jgi:hypothetical protein
LYALTDPLTFCPVYVESTRNPRGRYISHLYCTGLSNLQLHSWVRSQLNRGLIPGFRTLELVIGKELALKRERFHIKRLLLERIVLFNENIVSVKLELSKPPKIIRQDGSDRPKPIKRPRGRPRKTVMSNYAVLSHLVLKEEE